MTARVEEPWPSSPRTFWSWPRRSDRVRRRVTPRPGRPTTSPASCPRAGSRSSRRSSTRRAPTRGRSSSTTCSRSPPRCCRAGCRGWRSPWRCVVAVVMRSDLDTRWGLSSLMPKGPSQNVIARHVPKTRRGERLRQRRRRRALRLGARLARVLARDGAELQRHVRAHEVRARGSCRCSSSCSCVPWSRSASACIPWYVTLGVAAYLLIPLLINVHRELFMRATPGANDNASGVAAMLGVMERLVPEPGTDEDVYTTTSLPRVEPMRRSRGGRVGERRRPRGRGAHVLARVGAVAQAVRRERLRRPRTGPRTARRRARRRCRSSEDADEDAWRSFAERKPDERDAPTPRRRARPSGGATRSCPAASARPERRASKKRGRPRLARRRRGLRREEGRPQDRLAGTTSATTTATTTTSAGRAGRRASRSTTPTSPPTRPRASGAACMSTRRDRDLTEKEVWFVATGAEEVGTVGHEGAARPVRRRTCATRTSSTSTTSARARWPGSPRRAWRSATRPTAACRARHAGSRRENDWPIKGREYRGLSTDATAGARAAVQGDERDGVRHQRPAAELALGDRHRLRASTRRERRARRRLRHRAHQRSCRWRSSRACPSVGGSCWVIAAVVAAARRHRASPSCAATSRPRSLIGARVSRARRRVVLGPRRREDDEDDGR